MKANVYLFPCVRCPLRKDCALRNEWRAKVLGLGLSSAAFKCPILTAEIRLGRRVEILHPFFTTTVSQWRSEYAGQTEEDIAVMKKPVRASINCVYKRHRFSAIIDKGEFTIDDCIPDQRRAREAKTDNEIVNVFRRRKRMPHTRIVRFLDEPDAPPEIARSAT